MVINGSPIPNGYDNTYDTAEVSRPDMDRRANWAEEDPEAPQYIRNKEEGGGSGVGTELLIIRLDHQEEAYTYFDKTWQEVKDAYDAGTPVYLQPPNGNRYYMYYVGDGAVEFQDFRTNTNRTLKADTPDGALYTGGK